jgi:hypothetical protein
VAVQNMKPESSTLYSDAAEADVLVENNVFKN